MHDPAAQLQGKAIADGPLPFMFGRGAETIKARYWVHEMPAEVKASAPRKAAKASTAWKRCPRAAAGDAQNFSRGKNRSGQPGLFLPEIMEVFAPEFRPATNPSRQS